MGAVHPCGHVLHEECWHGWAAARHGRDQKCVTCNTAAAAFSRIYLDLSIVASQDDDNVDAIQEVKPPSRPNVDANGVICIDLDDDNNNEPKANYQDIAHRLKQRNKMLKSQLKEHTSQHQQMLRKLSDCKTEMEGLEKKLEGYADKLAQQQGDMDVANLQVIQLTRQRDEAVTQAAVQRDRATALEMQVEQLRHAHRTDVQKAHATSMTEVQRILAEQPKLKQEIQHLKERVKQLKRKTHESSDTKVSARKLLKEMNVVCQSKPPAVEKAVVDKRIASISQKIKPKRRPTALELLNQKG